jgi:hypothetical protein
VTFGGSRPRSPTFLPGFRVWYNGGTLCVYYRCSDGQHGGVLRGRPRGSHEALGWAWLLGGLLHAGVLPEVASVLPPPCWSRMNPTSPWWCY